MASLTRARARAVTIIDDDDEFTSCQHCKSNLKQYHNTSLSDTPSAHHYTQTLLGYGHLNCEKCGLFIPVHPEDPNESGLIFVCSAKTPHPHCLCYECAALYEVAGNADGEEKNDIVTQLMTDQAAQSTESCSIGSDASMSRKITIIEISSPFHLQTASKYFSLSLSPQCPQ